MPNRIIREAILSSERVAQLAWPEEVFYRRLMSIVDDYGRTEANPQLLRAKCYPLQTDAVRVTDISRWMAACQKAGLILCYDAQGKQYLELSNFGQQQRSASKCPAPLSSDSTCNQLIANAHLGVSVVEDVVVGDISSVSTDRIPYADIVDAYHAALPMLPQVRKLTKARKDKLRKCWLEDEERQTLAYWTQFFGYVATSDFLTGRNGRFTACDFEWLVEPGRHLKVSEGKYDNREAA